MKKLKVKSAVNGIFEFYSKYFSGLYAFCILLTSLTFAISIVLYKFSKFGTNYGPKIYNFYTVIYEKFSYQSIYSIVDFSKTIFLLFAALLAIAYFRYERKLSEPKSAFAIFFKNLNFKDFLILLPIATIACIADLFLFSTDSKIDQSPLDVKYAILIHFIIALLRLNIPAILLGIGVALLVVTNEIEPRWKALLTLIITLWLFSTVTYELAVLVVSSIIYGVGMFVNNLNIKNSIESILLIPIVAFFIPGFAAAFYYPFSLYEKKGGA